MALLWVGSKWGTSTNAIPGSFGIAFSKCVNASSPPAEAPTPTTGNPGPSAPNPESSGARVADSVTFDGREGARSPPALFFFLDFIDFM